MNNIGLFPLNDLLSKSISSQTTPSKYIKTKGKFLFLSSKQFNHGPWSDEADDKISKTSLGYASNKSFCNFQVITSGLLHCNYNAKRKPANKGTALQDFTESARVKGKGIPVIWKYNAHRFSRQGWTISIMDKLLWRNCCDWDTYIKTSTKFQFSMVGQHLYCLFHTSSNLLVFKHNWTITIESSIRNQAWQRKQFIHTSSGYLSWFFIPRKLLLLWFYHARFNERNKHVGRFHPITLLSLKTSIAIFINNN